MLACHWGSVTRTEICLTSLELTVHMSIHTVVSCSQSNQDDLVCYVLAVAVVCWIEVRVLLMSFSHREGLNNGFIGDRLVMLVYIISLFCKDIG